MDNRFSSSGFVTLMQIKRMEILASKKRFIKRECFVKNFLGVESRFTSYQKSSAVVLPIPFEKTTSYGKGTAKGPDAIIEASQYVELYDEETNTEPYRKGIHTMADMDCDGSTEVIFSNITDAISKLLNDNKFPVGIGGEHALTAPIFRAFNNHFQNLSILQLDAHADLRYSYEDSHHSHASVMRRVFEMNPNLVQVGMRAVCKKEADFIQNHNLPVFFAHHLHHDGFQQRIIQALQKNVYITLDVDYFDPSVIPATGTPEPGGFHWYETLSFLQRVFMQKRVVGVDVVELSPAEHQHHADFTISKLIYKLIGYYYKWGNT
ncbi:MAG: agmatinase [Caldithrix sp.]|nr:agmatinase [Caldithrix sp.]